MKSAVVKRSIMIGSHKTSVSLEDPFWEGLKAIAESRRVGCAIWAAASTPNVSTPMGQTVISAPGGTAFAITSEMYTGPTGNEPFQLVYGESFGAPAALEISLPLVSQTPLPAALPLFATGLGALGLLGWRRKRKARSILPA